MTEQKVFINNDNMATFVCPKCDKTATVGVSEYKEIDKAVRVQHTCACGHSHTVLLERRQFYRKDVSIPGEYFLPDENLKKAMTVKDLSRSGLKFETATEGDLKIGDKLFVEFSLDNEPQTMIQKEVMVKTVSGCHIGTAFCSRNFKNATDKAYDIAIGFYTFS